MAAILSTAQDDRLWSQLIRFIRDGKLVPIIGPELLEIPTPDGGIARAPGRPFLGMAWRGGDLHGPGADNGDVMRDWLGGGA